EGREGDALPDFRNVRETLGTLVLSVAALAVSSGPLLLCMVLVGDTSLMVAERDAPASLGAPLAALALVLAAVWMILYTPAALIVAALWKSVIRTLNPVIGLDTIRRMGLIYGQVLGLYAALSAVQWLAGFALGFVPYVGSLGRAVV